MASLDSVKQGGISVVSDAREALEALATAVGDYTVSAEYRARTTELAKEWNDTVSSVYATSDDGAALNQNQVIGLVNTLSDPRDVVVCAAGSMPETCTSCGGPGIARATTSNTATRAWVTDRRRYRRSDGGARPRRVHHGR